MGLLSLEGRTALVTGASRGIGRAAAKALAEAGARIALVSRDGEQPAEVARSFCPEALAPAGDLRNADDVGKVAEQALAERMILKSSYYPSQPSTGGA